MTEAAADILRELYPPPHQVSVEQRVPHGGLLAVPSPSAARLLLPANGKGAAASLRYARRPFNIRSKVQTSAARALLRSGAGRVLGKGFGIRRATGADSIESLLYSVLGVPVVIGVFLGPLRANRKPVLQVLDEDGNLLAIAKVGLTPLTRQLASTEAAALRELHERTNGIVQTPKLLHFGAWRGHTVLVQSALDVAGAPVNVDPNVRNEAMRQVAESNGVTTVPWAAAAYLRRLERRVEVLDDSAMAAQLHRALENLRCTGSMIRFGTWHGDWTPWNMAVRAGRALVWDWERYEKDVPVGFDALHYAFMLALKARSGQERSGIDLVARAAHILRPLGVPDSGAKTIAVSYLLELATRYLADKQAEMGGGSSVGQWLEPVLSTVHIGTLGTGDARG